MCGCGRAGKRGCLKYLSVLHRRTPDQSPPMTHPSAQFLSNHPRLHPRSPTHFVPRSFHLSVCPHRDPLSLWPMRYTVPCIPWSGWLPATRAGGRGPRRMLRTVRRNRTPATVSSRRRARWIARDSPPSRRQRARNGCNSRKQTVSIFSGHTGRHRRVVGWRTRAPTPPTHAAVAQACHQNVLTGQPAAHVPLPPPVPSKVPGLGLPSQSRR